MLPQKSPKKQRIAKIVLWLTLICLIFFVAFIFIGTSNPVKVFSFLVIYAPMLALGIFVLLILIIVQLFRELWQLMDES